MLPFKTRIIGGKSPPESSLKAIGRLAAKMENLKAMDTKLSFEEPKMEVGMIKKRLILSGCLILCLFLFAPVLFSPDATVSVTANFQSLLLLATDGTDTGNNLFTEIGDYTASEVCNFGSVDALGTAISGGDSMVNGQEGRPVDSTGNPLMNPRPPNCVGSFYSIFEAQGGNDETDHKNACMGIVGLGSYVDNFNLVVSATVAGSVTPGATAVSVGQLKWKDDRTASIGGYTGYTDFAALPQTILTGTGVVSFLLFHDYGLLVLYANATGIVTWTITYTLTAT
jgi:hypothetical protein